MENIWFCWKTNYDYLNLLLRPIIKTDNQIKQENRKRFIKRKKRNK